MGSIPQQAVVALGDLVEVTTATAQGPRRWDGYVCIIDGTRANVTSTDGSGAMAVTTDSPTLRVLEPADPKIATCADCQESGFLGRMLCGAHTPRALS